MTEQARSERVANPTVEERVWSLEDQVEALAEAVEVLAHGLETNPMEEPEDKKSAEAARRARELLLLVKTARRTRNS